MAAVVESSRNKVIPALSPTQEAACLELARGATVKEAAGRSGAGLSTLSKWLSTNPALPARVVELRSQLTSRAVGLLSSAMADASETLKMLCVESEDEMVRLRAAGLILSHGLKVKETCELEHRIAALEGSAS